MARLVVVSNRVPVPGDRNPAAGGLAVALASAIRPGSLWFGWSGRRAPTTSTVPELRTARGVTYATIDIGEADYRHFYLGFANGALYPLLLFRLGLMEFNAEDYAGYRAVNRAFAAALAPLLLPDDLVWVHDYHLLAVGAELRALGVGQRIGFFMHTPFVPPAVLSALAACDVIGFQTEEHRTAFVDGISRLLGIAVDSTGRFCHRGRLVTTLVAPVGIDVAGFARLAAQNVAAPAGRVLAGSLGGRLLAIGVDRLDYAKGLPNRIRAIDALLSRHPEHRRQVSFLQVAAPSREEVADYRRLRHELDRLVGAVNGRHAEADWTPLRYLARAVRRPVLAGYYRQARLGLVTPLRDGLNLVALEYVAAQDAADPGVLVLSRFAGAAELLREALIVNPFDAMEIAEAMHQALGMDLAERQERQAALRARVEGASARVYCAKFLAVLQEPAVPEAWCADAVVEPRGVEPLTS
jgi:trehalose 6-phosphate synthase